MFYCLSVTLLNDRVCANDFAIKEFEYGNAFDTFGVARLELRAPCTPVAARKVVVMHCTITQA